MNNVSLTGRLTKAVDLRYTSTGKAVASFTLAVRKQFKREGEPDSDFINCQIWDKQAEALANNTDKGSQIGVTGRISTRIYDGNDGKKVYVTEVVANSFDFLDKKSESNSNTNTGGYQQNSNTGTFNGNTDPFGGTNKTIDITDDDLPF